MRSLPALTAAVVAFGWALGAAPATAHDDANVHEIHWVDQEPDNNSPDEGEQVYGTDFVAARADFDDGIVRWRIEMRHEAGGGVAFCDKSGSFGTDHSFRCNWDTAHLGDMSDLDKNEHLTSDAVAPNGRYIIKVSVWNVGRTERCGGLLQPSCTGPSSEHVLSPSRTVVIVNPVSAPTGVGRSYNSGNGRVTVAWASSPEPDVTKYLVQEQKDGGAWKDVGERPHGSTSFERYLPEMGTYRYRVAAVRPEVDHSAWTATAPLEVAAPPAPPQETPRNDPEDPGPEPGVTVLEPPTTATTTQSGTVAPTSPPPTSGGGSSLFGRPSASSLPRPTAPRTTPTTADTGFSEQLPYTTTTKAPEPDQEERAGEEDSQPIPRVVTVPRPQDPRSLLVPLAGGLAIFVFAMQVTYVVRRRPALAQFDDDFSDDWTGL